MKEGFYKGWMTTGVMHGWGELRLNGPGHVIYYSIWVDGIMSADNVIKTSSFSLPVEDSFYEGPVKEGFYKGGWKNGNMHGKGELKMSGPGHVTYYATWENGKMCEEEMIIKTSSLPHTLSKKE